MRNLIIILLVLIAICANAQQQREYIRIICDKDVYMAGEKMNVAIDVTDSDGRPSSLSSVAYVELSDARRMVGLAMASLKLGKGDVSLDIPSTIHSGTYQIAVYTRYMRNFGDECFKKQNVGIINVMHISHEDRVIFVEKDTLGNLTNGGIASKRNYRLGEQICVALPDTDIYRAVSIEPLSCVSDLCVSSKPQDYSLESSRMYVPEVEGHIVEARNANPDNPAYRSRLALIGRAVKIFDGQNVGDTIYRFYTNGIEGRQPMMVTGYSVNGAPVELKVVSPYAKAKVGVLPPLTVNYNKTAIERRCVEVNKRLSNETTVKLDSVDFTTTFMSTEPDRFYDLSEYAKFSSVNEILIEFVRGVRREKINGGCQLFTQDPVTMHYSEWPALVLLDGIPVDDVDKIMQYDARRLRYVQIYNETYTFGETVRKGVISFISHKGRLSNIDLGDAAKLFSYNFPSVRKVDAEAIRWIVDPKKNIVIDSPTEAGVYKIVAYGSKGRNVAIVEVK